MCVASLLFFPETRVEVNVYKTMIKDFSVSFIFSSIILGKQI